MLYQPKILRGPRTPRNREGEHAGKHMGAALHDGRTNEAVSGDMTLRHSLYVWTDAGAWYAYSLDPLRGGECALVDEQRLVSAAR